MTKQIGPYQVVRKLAVGGMAEIFLARHLGLEGLVRQVIIKRILPEKADSAEFETMFLDEARLMAALSHPHIAQVFDLGKADGAHFLVMEYVRGPTLKALIAEKAGGRLPEREALAIVMRVAEALHYLHGRRDPIGRPLGIVHRDLNPANVMVSYDGSVKLIDFGIAKAKSKVYETRTGVIKGTHGYIAPEQFDSTIPVDHRADVFALGVLLYELIVGVHPFDASDEPSLLDRVLKAAYRRPREVRTDVHPQLDELIAHCLSPHPDDRPSSMKDVLSRLVGHMMDQRWVVTGLDIAALVEDRVPDTTGPAPVSLAGSATRTTAFGGSSASSAGSFLEEPLRDEPIGRAMRNEFSENGDSTAVKPRPGEQTLAAPPPDMDSGPADTDMVKTHSIGASFDDTAEPTNVDVPSMAPARTEVVRAQTSAPRRWLWVLAAAVVLVGAATTAFLIASSSDEDTESAASPAPPAPVLSPGSEAAMEPAPEFLMTIVSEPPGAILFVDGERQPERTPFPLRLPASTDEVRLRLVRTGYLPQERTVVAESGEARFVLRRRVRTRAKQRQRRR